MARGEQGFVIDEMYDTGHWYHLCVALHLTGSQVYMASDVWKIEDSWNGYG
jgi:hypothetical protein